MEENEDIKPIYIAPVPPVATSMETNSNYVQMIENFEKNVIGNMDSSDVTIKCDGKKFYCSQSVLSGKSPVFKLMFQTLKKDEKTGSSEIENLIFEEIEFPNDVVKRMLFYLYSGIVPDVENWFKELLRIAEKYQLQDLKMSLGEKLISSLNEGKFKSSKFKELLRIADKYQFQDLKISLGVKLISTLNEGNCIEYLNLGNFFQLKELEEASLCFIKKDMESFFERKKWKKDLEHLPSSLAEKLMKKILLKSDSQQKDKRPRGFARKLEPERILETSTNDDGELFFLIKWKNCVDEDLVPAKEVNLKIPQLAIKFFEERLTFIDNHTEDEEEIERRRLVI